MSFDLIVTLGPSLDSRKIKEIHQEGPTIFRINGAHADVQQARNLISKVRSIVPDARIMIDLPGNKIRTAQLSTPIGLVKDGHFELQRYEINFQDFYKFVRAGDIILANDSRLKFEVLESKEQFIRFRSYSEGVLENNKGLHLRGVGEHLPFLFQRDLDLIGLASAMEIDYISLSYVRTAKDVEEAKKVLKDNQGTQIQVIAKIETSAALKNLHEILKTVDLINVDRGDLSSDIGMLDLFEAVENIVEKGILAGKRVYLATQFLKNMETYPVPLISEVMNLASSIKAGIHGIQLSEETAVGKYPLDCVKLVHQIAQLKGRKLAQRACDYTTQVNQPIL